MVMDEIIELCAGSELASRLEAKHRVSDSPIQVPCFGLRAGISFCLPAAALLRITDKP
jgi:hypothetical protein